MLPTTLPLPSPDAAALRAAVTGPVLPGGGDEAMAELAGMNTSVRHRPRLVVGAASASDVSATVEWAGRHGLGVAVHATGHSGTTLDDVVVVTTRRMDDVTVDPARRTARAGAGARWGAVVRRAARHGLAPLNGSSPTVGVVGYTLGGGTGPLARRYGFAADHVRRLEVVTADGRIRDVDPSHDPDLYWALLGGKGNFGVVTAVEFDLLPVATLHGGGLHVAGKDVERLLAAYPGWAEGLPEATTTSVALLRLPDVPQVPAPLRGRVTLHLRYSHLGPDAEGDALLAPMRAIVTPVLDTVRRLAYGQVATIFNDPTDPAPFWSGGALLASLPPAAVGRLLDAAGPGRDAPLAVVEVRHLGGALARQARFPNAVPGREAAYALAVVAPTPPPLAGTAAAAGEAVLAAMRPWRTTTQSLNLLHAPEAGAPAGSAWTPQVYRRLLEVKNLYDPHNVFATGYALIPR